VRKLLLVGLLVLAACDWRGYEHEKKVLAQRQGAAAQDLQQRVDEFDQRCAKDASACWDELVRASGVAAIGPDKGQVVTQVCCFQPKTAVSEDASFPSGFVVERGAGRIVIGVLRTRAAIAGSGTVRGQTARIQTRSDRRISMRWNEGGLQYIATVSGLDLAQAEQVLAAMVVHRP
jgi:hypothetical protein